MSAPSGATPEAAPTVEAANAPISDSVQDTFSVPLKVLPVLPICSVRAVVSEAALPVVF